MEERESRVWPGQGQGRRGSRCPDKFPGHRCELRRGPDRQTGGMVSPALFPCGRTGSAREGVAHEDLVVAANVGVSVGGDFCEGDDSGSSQGSEEAGIHSNHRTCFFLEPSIPGAALALVASQIPNDGGGGRRLLGNIGARPSSTGREMGIRLPMLRKAKRNTTLQSASPQRPPRLSGGMDASQVSGGGQAFQILGTTGR